MNAILKQIHPQKDEILEISIDEADQSKVVRVCALLSDEMQRAIVDFLKQNMSTFAGTTSDIKRQNSRHHVPRVECRSDYQAHPAKKT